jgi:hypothetical protein
MNRRTCSGGNTTLVVKPNRCNSRFVSGTRNELRSKLGRRCPIGRSLQNPNDRKRSELSSQLPSHYIAIPSSHRRNDKSESPPQEEHLSHIKSIVASTGIAKCAKQVRWFGRFSLFGTSIGNRRARGGGEPTLPIIPDAGQSQCPGHLRGWAPEGAGLTRRQIPSQRAAISGNPLGVVPSGGGFVVHGICETV